MWQTCIALQLLTSVLQCFEGTAVHAFCADMQLCMIHHSITKALTPMQLHHAVCKLAAWCYELPLMQGLQVICSTRQHQCFGPTKESNVNAMGEEAHHVDGKSREECNFMLQWQQFCQVSRSNWEGFRCRPRGAEQGCVVAPAVVLLRVPPRTFASDVLSAGNGGWPAKQPAPTGKCRLFVEACGSHVCRAPDRERIHMIRRCSLTSQSGTCTK